LSGKIVANLHSSKHLGVATRNLALAVSWVDGAWKNLQVSNKLQVVSLVSAGVFGKERSNIDLRILLW
jgi:hypothetical protein